MSLTSLVSRDAGRPDLRNRSNVGMSKSNTTKLHISVTRTDRTLACRKLPWLLPNLVKQGYLWRIYFVLYQLQLGAKTDRQYATDGTGGAVEL